MADDNSEANSTGTLTITLPNCLEVKPSSSSENPTESMGTGGIFLFAGKDVPDGWLICNGAAVNRSTYADLFQVIGTTYGVGNGSTTFNVPDLRGRFPLGLDNMGGTSANRVRATAADQLGGSGGAETHTLTIAEMPAHGHDVGVSVHESSPNLYYGSIRSAMNKVFTTPTDPPSLSDNEQRLVLYVTGSDTPLRSLHATNNNRKSSYRLAVGGKDASLVRSAGGGQAHNNMPPYLAMNYLIKT